MCCESGRRYTFSLLIVNAQPVVKVFKPRCAGLTMYFHIIVNNHFNLGIFELMNVLHEFMNCLSVPFLRNEYPNLNSISNKNYCY